VTSNALTFKDRQSFNIEQSSFGLTLPVPPPPCDPREAGGAFPSHRTNYRLPERRATDARQFRADLCASTETKMATGTVKWFNKVKGYGFIQPGDGGKDVFVHITAVERAGMDTLVEGQRINYDLVNERGKSAAANLKAG
jgi:CspA family cold shock protein